MGREVTGVLLDQKSPYAKVKPKVSADADREGDPKSPEGSSDVKDCEVKECTSEVQRVEDGDEKQDILAIRSTNFDAEKPEIKSAKTEDLKSSSHFKTKSETEAVGNNTPQKPADVTVDRQAYQSPIAVETPISPTESNSKSPNSAKKSQPSTPIVARKNFIDEDNWSMASSTAASVRTARSRTTVGVAPTFTCNQRLERRKEYYAKLEEKRKALEAEKQEYEERTKEDEAAAVKQLRKSMMYKANPVPSFYYEKPPPKKELKKLPTTRAVSPKFGRRKSCSDATSRTPEDKICGRSSRHSLGSYREGSNPTSAPRKKDQPVGSSGSKGRDRSKVGKETKTIKKSPSKMAEQTNADIAVQS